MVEELVEELVEEFVDIKLNNNFPKGTGNELTN